MALEVGEITQEHYYIYHQIGAERHRWSGPWSTRKTADDITGGLVQKYPGKSFWVGHVVYRKERSAEGWTYQSLVEDIDEEPSSASEQKEVA
jgi:hypothetical protein